MRPGQKIKLKPIEELLGVVNEESAMDIEIAEIHSFKGHPFRVVDDDRMQELVESVRANGVLSPVLIRPDDTAGGYEMISGHRRLHAAALAGLERIPAIIRELTDDEAVIAMVDANIQREELLPSEKAFAYKMKVEAMKHQGARSDLTSGQNVPKYKRTTEMVADGTGESYKQIQRYIRLTELVPELLNLVDQKRLQFTVAVEISYLEKYIQQWLYEYIHDNGAVKPNQIAALRDVLQSGSIDQDRLITILRLSEAGKNPSKKVVLKERMLKKYFPPEYTVSEMEHVVLGLLEQWRSQQEE